MRALSTTHASRRRTATISHAAALLLVGAVILTGCADDPEPEPSPTVSETETPTPSPEPEPTLAPLTGVEVDVPAAGVDRSLRKRLRKALTFLDEEEIPR